ncbi:relaxase/mobilization nuclease domain-containing protein [Cetobacterium sp. 2A]|uniref:relaxase/mobilization nuclease domain-containing protein n=1 Tax=Cetobacterium sp. 2A TaxID=2754723 RepID=UPI00163B7CD3|nr:relaxase/mobilization nuclease domain-containing protein [Cetobacterium sp. 2A]MBC2857241.1 relaxase/mobilization nuclease domain-containing protein [Cetobacterium sp. 2A]
MGIFKSIDNPSTRKGGSKSALDYVGKKAELTKGINCSDDYIEAYKDFQETKELYNKLGGRQFKHFVLSFGEETKSNEIALEMSEKIASKIFNGHEVFLAVHSDTDNLHCHMVVNSVNVMTGYKYSHSKQELENYKEVINEIGKDYNFVLTKNQELVSEIQNTTVGDIKIYNKSKLKSVENHFSGKKESDLVNTYSIVIKVLEENRIKSIKEFGSKLLEQGIKLDWQEQRKNITFELDTKYSQSKKNKFRLSNLSKSFSDPKLTKENLELIFEKNLYQEQIKEAERIKKQELIKIKSKARDKGMER